MATMTGNKLRPEQDLVSNGRDEAFVSKAISIHEIVNIPFFMPASLRASSLGVCLDCFIFSIDKKCVFCHDNLPQADSLTSFAWSIYTELYATGLTTVCQWIDRSKNNFNGRKM